MNIIIFKTQDALFKFNQKTVKERIIKNNNYDITETDKLLKLISAGHINTLMIPKEPSYFDHIAIDLIATGHGSVLCKTCNKTYPVKQLKSIITGAGKNPLNIHRKKKGIIKRMFSKKRRTPTMSGGKGYLCPEGHNLISVITWKLF